MRKRVIVATIQKIFIIAVIINTILFSLNGTTNGKINLKFRDFLSYKTGLSTFLHEPKNLYDVDTQIYYQNKLRQKDGNQLLPFLNPPPLLLILFPLAFLSLDFGYKLFVVVNLGLYLWLTSRLAKVIFARAAEHHFTIALVFLPGIGAILGGQISIILLAIFTLVLVTFLNKKHFKLGFYASLLLIKPQFIFFVPFLAILLKDKLNFFRGFVVGTLIFILVSVTMNGIGYLTGYPKFIGQTNNGSYGSGNYRSISLVHPLQIIIDKIDPSQHWPYVLVLVVYIFTLYFFKKYVNPQNKLINYASAVLFSLVFAIHLIGHDLVLLIIPIFVLLLHFQDKKHISFKYYYFLFFLILLFIPILSLIGRRFLISLILLLIGYLLIYIGHNPQKSIAKVKQEIKFFD